MTPHFDVAQWILKYVKNTVDYDFLYIRSEDSKLIRYCDVNYAGDHDNKEKPLGMCLSLV